MGDTHSTPSRIIMKGKRVVAFLLLLGCICLPISGCDYIERFLIQLEEAPNSYPCVGVVHFSFVIETLSENQEEIVQHKYTEEFSAADLFWNTTTGKCQLEGIPLKKIPYGGERILTIKGYDSTRFPVVRASSQKFLVEPKGEEVKDTVNITLKRATNASRGTLIIRFDTPPPKGTNVVHLTLAAKDNLQKEIRTIPIPETPPKFVIVTNVPPSTNRTLYLEAYSGLVNGKTQKLAKSQEKPYTIDVTQPRSFLSRVSVAFQAVQAPPTP